MSFNSLRNFFQLEAAGGICLVIGACAALLVANSPWSAHYAEVFSPSFSIIFENAKMLLRLWRSQSSIGFTMSLFIDTLAFEHDAAFNYQAGVRIGVLTGSVVSAIVGSFAHHQLPW